MFVDITVKISLVDVDRGTVDTPLPLRLHPDQTVGQLKESAAILLKSSVTELCSVVEKSFNVLHRLTNDQARLYSESIGKGARVSKTSASQSVALRTRTGPHASRGRSAVRWLERMKKSIMF